jgi:hypothetical protein
MELFAVMTLRAAVLLEICLLAATMTPAKKKSMWFEIFREFLPQCGRMKTMTQFRYLPDCTTKVYVLHSLSGRLIVQASH